jgi:regulatory protein
METNVKTISALLPDRDNRVQRTALYLDGKLAFSLDNEVVLKEKLKVGQTLAAPLLARLKNSDDSLRCLNAAYRFLSLRPRSRDEIVQRLSKLGFTESAIEPALLKLTALHLLDDAAFAEYWKENRTAFRPRSQRMLKQELSRKGLDSEVIGAAISGVDETANAYQAAIVKARRLPATDYLEFRNKLSGFLQRRGFGYSVIKKTVQQVWQEKSGETVISAENEENNLKHG